MSRVRKVGIPSGGSTSQVLKKSSNNDYEVEWGAGGGGGGHVIKEGGTPLTQRAGLNFDGNDFNLSDDAGNNETDVAINDSKFATRIYAESLVTGLWDDRGNFDASVNAYPSSGGSGTAGAILKGDIWTISVAGTLPTGQVVEPGDTVRALVDTPGNTQANWAIAQNNIGYVPENQANKENSTIDTNATKYPTVNLLKTGLDTKEPLITTLPISKGGTNSSTALNNNRVMVSESGAIKEAAAITANRLLKSDANGVPTHTDFDETYLTGSIMFEYMNIYP